MIEPPAKRDHTPVAESVVLIVAHGSRNPLAETEHRQLCDTLDLGARTTVRPAFLEMTEPTVTDAINRAVHEGAAQVTVLPYFLNSGNHVMVDLPELVDAARSRHPGVSVHLERHLGADPALVELLATQIAGVERGEAAAEADVATQIE